MTEHIIKFKFILTSSGGSIRADIHNYLVPMAADPKIDRVGRRKGAFWARCNAAFDAVDSGSVSLFYVKFERLEPFTG